MNVWTAILTGAGICVLFLCLLAVVAKIMTGIEQYEQLKKRVKKLERRLKKD